MTPFLGPALGPLTGAYIIDEYHDNWRFSMWVIMMIASPVSVMALFMSETSHSRILYLRTKKEGIKMPRKTGDTLLLLRKLRTGFIRPLHMMFVEECRPHLPFWYQADIIIASRSLSKHLHWLRLCNDILILRLLQLRLPIRLPL